MEETGQETEDIRKDIFVEVANALNIVISPVIKNVLLINGFNNPLLLGNICDQDLLDMENFMRETAPLVIDERECQSYYGLFHRKKECFKFVPGQRKTIFVIAEFFKSKYSHQNNALFSGSSTNSSISTKPRTKQTSSSNEGGVEGTSQNKTPERIIDFTNETRQVSVTVKNWFKGKCSNIDAWNTLKEEYSRIVFEVKYGQRNEVCCIMRCFCETSHKILRVPKKENLAQRWVYGNFYKHLMTHLKQSDATPIQYQYCKRDCKKKPNQSRQNLLTTFLQQNPRQNLSTETKDREVVNILTIDEELREKPNKPNNMILISPEKSSKVTSSDTSPVKDKVWDEVENASKINVVSNQVIRESYETCSETCKSISKAQASTSRDSCDDTYHIQKGIQSNQSNNYTPKGSPSGSSNDLNMVQSSIQSSSSTLSNTLSKWSSPKYQRLERAKRKRLSQICSPEINQTCTTSYFSVVDEVSNFTKNIIERKDEMGMQLQSVLVNFESTLQKPRDQDDTNSPGQLLRWLFDLSAKNSSQSKYRNTYDDRIKYFSLYLFYVGGRLLYETLYENMKSSLPSISCLNKFIANNSSNIEEGFFDFDGLCQFMEQRNLPKVLWISEDATRVTSKIEYDSRTNKLVGFTIPLVDGIPARDTFLATSAKSIQDHFKNATRSNYAYVIMAQPISPAAPGYCLAIFGTDNRFTAADVTKRWQYIKLNLKARGVIVLGFGSDGDTRLLKAMRQGAQLSSTKDPSRPEWRWFQANYSTDDCASYVQDTVHIATKLRTRLLNDKITLRFGDFYATAKQLEQLIAEHSKDKHLLTKSDLKLEDKMNFKAAEKLCSNNVINLLEQAPQNEGIVAYLKLMRLVIDSFLDPKIDVTHRIYLIWYCVFFLRIWRQWLTTNKYKIGNHFISSNCYACVELNAHSLINIVINIRENPSLSSDMFLPLLFGSQKCEQTFRTMRSMTSTYSTVVNFDVKDILRRLDRIKTVNNIIHDLNNVIAFPREQKRQEKMNIDTNLLVVIDLKHYTDTMIADAVERARQDALAHTRELGMSVEENSLYYGAIPPLKDLVKDESKDESLEDEEDIQIDDKMIDTSDSSSRGSANVSPNMLQHFTSLPIENEEINGDDLNNSNSQLFKDLCNISSVGVMDNLILRNYDQRLMDQAIEDGPFVRVAVGNKSKIVRKSSLCWLLEETKNRVSTDRLQRFVVKSTGRTQSRTLKVGHKKLNSRLNLLKSKGTYIKRSSNRCKRDSSRDSSDSSEDDTIIKYDDSPSTETFSENDSENGMEINVNKGEYQGENLPKQYFPQHSSSSALTIFLEINKFYAVYYDEGWFVGKLVRHIDGTADNPKVEITFLRQNKRKKSEFKWPGKQDLSNVQTEYIFFGPISIKENESNIFNITEDVLSQINIAYTNKKQNF